MKWFKKNIFYLCFLIINTSAVISCTQQKRNSQLKNNSINSQLQKVDKFLENEIKKTFNFFINFANKKSQGFGLMPDRVKLGDVDNGVETSPQSSDAIGFYFAALAIGTKKGWISFEEGKNIAEKLSQTVLKLKHFNGYITHFTDRQGNEWINKNAKGQVISTSEESSITTGLIIQGMIVADSYFKSKIINNNLKTLINRIPWTYKTNIISHNSKDLIRMSSNNGIYDKAKWDWSAEQQMLYLIVAANPNVAKKKAKKIYSSFKRVWALSGENKFVKEFGGTLFTYQFAHQFIDFKKIKTINSDPDWWENSKRATKYDMEFSKKRNIKNKINNPELYWGVSAQDSLNGYTVNGIYKGTDDTYAPWGQIGSIEYFPSEVKKTFLKLMDYKFQDLYKIYHEDYGLYDGYNIKKDWVASTMLSIDKGLELVALVNYYENNFVRNMFMSNEIIKNAIAKLEWKVLT